MHERLAAFARGSAERARDLFSTAELRRRLVDAPPVRPLDPGPFVLIAEVKFRAPSAGALAADLAPPVGLHALVDDHPGAGHFCGDGLGDGLGDDLGDCSAVGFGDGDGSKR